MAETKICPHCKMVIDKKASICPHCRRRQGMSLLGKIILIIIALIFIGYFIPDYKKTSRVNPPRGTSGSRSSSSSPVEYIVKAKLLRIRAAPTAKSEIIGTLKMGESIFLNSPASLSGEGEGLAWVKVRNGYVHSNYIIRKSALRDAKPYVEILNSSWTRSEYGSRAEFTITLRNNAPWDIKDVQFHTGYYSKSGTLIDYGDETVYEIFPAGSTKTVKIEEFIRDQVYKAGVTVKDAKWEWQEGKPHLDW